MVEYVNIRGVIRKRVLLSIFDQLNNVTSSIIEYVRAKLTLFK